MIYRAEGDFLEILAIRTTPQRQGAGTALLEAMERTARSVACGVIQLATTNDNVDALRLYQRRGFAARAYLVEGFREVLRMKGGEPHDLPEGCHGITIRDVIVLAKPLT